MKVITSQNSLVVILLNLCICYIYSFPLTSNPRWCLHLFVSNFYDIPGILLLQYSATHQRQSFHIFPSLMHHCNNVRHFINFVRLWCDVLDYDVEIISCCRTKDLFKWRIYHVEDQLMNKGCLVYFTTYYKSHSWTSTDAIVHRRLLLKLPAAQPHSGQISVIDAKLLCFTYVKIFFKKG